MTAVSFEASIRHKIGIAVIDVRGDVDAFAEEAFNTAYAKAISGDKLLASGLSDHYREIFQITRLTDFISIFPDVETALASASASAKDT